MRTRLPALAATALLALVLSACTPQPAPDWQALEGSADDYLEYAAAQDDALGSGSMRLSPEDPAPSEEGGVTLEYDADVQVTRVSVACFGDGTAQFGYTVRTGSNWVGEQSVELSCNGEEETLTPGQPGDGVNAIRFNGILNDGSGAVLAASVSGEGAPGEPAP